MYRHTVDCIMETDNKVFVSTEEKKKFNTYPDKFATIEHTYDKEELDTFMSELQVKNVTVEGEVITETNTKPSVITDIELYGNTKHRVEEIVREVTLSDGLIAEGSGTEYDDQEGKSVRTNYLEVKYLDVIHYKNNDKSRAGHLYVFDSNKKFIGYRDIVKGEYTITDINAGFVRFVHWKNDIDNLKLYVSRTHLSDIQSVGERLSDGGYRIKLHSTSKNIFDVTSDSEIGFINDSGDIYYDNTSWIIHDYLPIPETDKITVSETSINFYQYRVSFYDCNKKFIGLDQYTGYSMESHTFNVPKGSVFYRLSYSIYVNGSRVTRENIQVELGDKMTDYTEYGKSVSEVTLPVQLERIGDVADRLFKREDGVWCVEKNINTITLDGTEDTEFSERTPAPPYRRFAIKIKDLLLGNSNKLSVLSNRLPSYPFGQFYVDDTIVGISNVNNVNDLSIRLHESSLPSNTTGVESIKEWLKSNNLMVKYVVNTADIIELPLDVQISLNTFYGETTVFTESGYNTGKLKLTIPKSLYSSIDSLVEKTKSVSKTIKNIKALREGQVVDYTSNKGFINLSETNNGIVDNIKLEGQTLFNLLPQYWGENYTYGDVNHAVGTEKDYFRRCPTLIPVKPNTVYTVVANVVRNTITTGQFFVLIDRNYPGDFIGGEKVMIREGVKGLVVAKFMSNDVIEDRTHHKTYLRTTSTCTNPGIVEIRDMMIIEGDHTDKPISYFEGLKSVGDGVDSIKLKSSKRNILDLLKYTPVINGNNGVKVSMEEYDSNRLRIKTLPGNTNKYPSVWFNNVEFIPGRTYRVKAKVTKSDSTTHPRFSIRSSSTFNVPLKDIAEYNGVINGTFIPTSNRHRIEFFGGNHVGTLEDTEVLFEDIQITLEDDHEYTTPNVNEKSLYYIDKNKKLNKVVLRSLPNGLKDHIKKHEDGKYYLHKLCEEVILDGSEPWYRAKENHNNENYSLYVLSATQFTSSKNLGSHKNLGDCISDRLPKDKDVALQSYSNEAICLGTNIDIKLKNERFESLCDENIKEWLAANPLTLVYQLDKEEVYECVDMTLNLYDNTGTIMCDAGPIFPKMTVSVATFIGNVLCNIKDRVSKLEDALYQRYLFRNKMMLQNMYMSDDTLFKVAVEVVRTSVSDTSEDLDLITLILKNIEPGKENYDRSYMENVIDFYTMISKISFETAEELFMIIEDQHNIIDNEIIEL